MLRKLSGRLVRLVLSSCLLRTIRQAMPASLKQPELALVLVHYRFRFLFVLCFAAGWPCFLFGLSVTQRMARRGRRLSNALKNRSRRLLGFALSRSCFRHLAASSLVKIWFATWRACYPRARALSMFWQGKADIYFVMSTAALAR